MAELQERVVTFRPRTILVILSVTLFFALVLALIYLAWHVITWILIAVFLAAALNPAVEFFERRGLKRGLASGIVFLLTVLGIGAVAAIFIPPLVREVRDFIEAVPEIVADITAGRGPLGFLEREYDVVERVRAAVLQLPPRQRELMTALFFEEGTYAEIAARFGYSIDSIGALRGRCFRALQGALADLKGR